MTEAPALPAADLLTRLGHAAAERANPIVVKELRQGLRTRMFWVFFTLTLSGYVLISLAFFAGSTADSTGGQAAFTAYFVCLAVVQFFVIPYTAFRSMARETEEETWVLLTLTGLGARRILAGKVTSFVVQGLLYSSAAAPFLLFSYYLNGIDLPTILVALVAAVAYQVFWVSAAVSLGTLADSRLTRALLNFVLLGMLTLGTSTGISLSVALAQGARSLVRTGSFWLASAVVTLLMVTTGVLLFEVAASRLALLTEDYARGPRLAFVVQTLAGLLLFLWAYAVSGDGGTLVAAAVTATYYLMLVGTYVASDRDGMAPGHWTGRGARFRLLRPGALRGTWLVLVVLAVVVAALGTAGVAGGATGDELTVVLAVPSFAVVFICAPVVLGRLVPRQPHQTPAMVRLVALALFAVAAGVPPVLGELAGRPADLVLNALNPVVGVVNLVRHPGDAAALGTAVWAVGAALAATATVMLVRLDGGRR